MPPIVRIKTAEAAETKLEDEIDYFKNTKILEKDKAKQKLVSEPETVHQKTTMRRLNGAMKQHKAKVSYEKSRERAMMKERYRPTLE